MNRERRIGMGLFLAAVFIILAVLAVTITRESNTLYYTIDHGYRRGGASSVFRLSRGFFLANKYTRLAPISTDFIGLFTIFRADQLYPKYTILIRNHLSLSPFNPLLSPTNKFSQLPLKLLLLKFLHFYPGLFRK